MPQPLVECVPNFSEGRDKSVIDRIIAPIEGIRGVKLLDVDMGADFNRTVVTMVGHPDDVLNAVIECSIVASDLIDMRGHSGEHARMGAIDVVHLFQSETYLSRNALAYPRFMQRPYRPNSNFPYTSMRRLLGMSRGIGYQTSGGASMKGCQKRCNQRNGLQTSDP